VTIATEYRGYRIAYSENEDEWSCYEAGKGISHAKLTAVKAKIDALFLAERKRGATACLEIDLYGSACVTLTDATVIEYLGPKLERRNGVQIIVGQKVAVVARRRGSEKAARREGELSGLAPNAPETLAAWAEAQRLFQTYADAKKAYDAAVTAIPRLSLADVMPLVTISGINPEGKA
jgi:hypothetical protein